MPYAIETSRFSFVQFAETDTVGNCNFADNDMCLPTYDENDAWFQFVVVGDTVDEADDLCAGAVPLTIGIVEQCSDGFLLQFAEKPTRHRISPLRVGYAWQHGIPGFQNVISVGECFHFKVRISVQEFCTNCFQRIGDDCHTSVIEYTNEDNAFGFQYCAGGVTDEDGGTGDDCAPTEIPFVHASTMVIPWTAYLNDKYGPLPSIEVWVYDENGDLIKPGIVAKLNGYPPTQVYIDFGGDSSGIVKIM
jgi:hypothetical protein